MSFLFYNNWPYSYSVFPTMEDHIDAVNNTYFTGLHTEIENIENALGLSPEGAFDTVAQRLDSLPTAKMSSVLLPLNLAVAPSSAAAEITTLEYTNRILKIINFDKTTDEGTSFCFPVPTRFTSSNIKITLFGMCSVTSGTAKMYCPIYIRKDNDDFSLDVSPDYNQSIDMVAKASGNYLIVNSVSFSAPLFVSGAVCHFQVRRNAALGGDDMDSDFTLIGVKIEEV